MNLKTNSISARNYSNLSFQGNKEKIAKEVWKATVDNLHHSTQKNPVQIRADLEKEIIQNYIKDHKDFFPGIKRLFKALFNK